MIWMFFLGLMVGSVIGAVLMACCAINSQRGDDRDGC